MKWDGNVGAEEATMPRIRDRALGFRDFQQNLIITNNNFTVTPKLSTNKTS